MIGQRGQDHVRADCGHQHFVGEGDAYVEHARAGVLRRLDRGVVERVDRAGAGHLLLGGARPDQRPQPRHERRRVERLVAVGLDRLRRRRQGVQASEDRVDGFDRKSVGALAQKLEHVLHLVGELRDRREAHRRAHALERVGDAEDLLDGRAVLGVLFEPDDRKIQLFEVLARLRDEHRHVLGGVHHDFR